MDYNGAGLLTSATFTGLTGAPYSTYQYDYVGGVFSGSQFTFTTVPAGATYSSYETDYNQAGNFTGDSFSSPISRASPTPAKKKISTPAARSPACCSPGSPIRPIRRSSSIIRPEPMRATKPITRLTGQSYTSEEVDVSAANQLEKVVYSGMTSTPYSSVEQDYSGGTLADVIYNFTNVTGADYNSYQVEDNASAMRFRRRSTSTAAATL